MVIPQTIQVISSLLLAFVLAGGFAVIGLVTTEYPHTYFLLLSPRRCWALYAYALLYGVVGVVLALTLNSLITTHLLRVEGLGLSKPVVRAIYVGVATKSFLQFSLFSIGEDRVGIATVTNIFEKPLLRAITLNEDNFVKEYLKPYIRRYPSSADVRKRIIADIPAKIPNDERKAFELDIRHETKTTAEAMRLTLMTLGRYTLNRIFPL